MIAKSNAVLPMAMAATCNQELNRLFHVTASAANQQQTTRLSVVEPRRPKPCNAGRSARLGRVFEFLQAPVAILSASPGAIAPLASAEVTAFIAAAISWAFSPRALSRGGALDRRQCEFYGAFAARRQDALEAQPHRSRVAGESEFDRPARQHFGLTRQKCRGGKRRLVARAALSPLGIARPPSSYGHPRARPGGFDIRPSVIDTSVVQLGSLAGTPSGNMRCDLGNFEADHYRNVTIPPRTIDLALSMRARGR
jgi:hypothetical protein